MNKNSSRRRSVGADSKRAARKPSLIPAKMTGDEAAALRAYWGTRNLADTKQRGMIRCVSFIDAEDLASIKADEFLAGIVVPGEGNLVLARGRALRNALRSYLTRANRHDGGAN